jgi:hypothetical protein
MQPKTIPITGSSERGYSSGTQSGHGTIRRFMALEGRPILDARLQLARRRRRSCSYRDLKGILSDEDYTPLLIGLAVASGAALVISIRNLRLVSGYLSKLEPGISDSVPTPLPRESPLGE